jgi:flagellin-like protein
MNRKGISPILAAVLLFAVTVSVVGIFANFAPNLVTSLTSGTQEQASGQIECEGAGMAFEGVTNDGTNSATYTLRNTGNEDLLNVSIVSFDADNSVLTQNESINVYTGNLTTVRQYDFSSEPEYVQAFSGQCGSIELRQEL